MRSRLLTRWQRRHRVALAFDMAAEIARYLPPQASVLDVGCGNGFIAHHLSGLLGIPAVGVDVTAAPEAPIRYQSFDGSTLPFDDARFDAVLLCYVLHHAQDPAALVHESRRVLRPGGRVLVYEDLPTTWIDRLLCWRHERAWRARSGPCTFQHTAAWEGLFQALGLSVVASRRLSRLRDPSHPVSRALFVLERPLLGDTDGARTPA